MKSFLLTLLAFSLAFPSLALAQSPVSIGEVSPTNAAVNVEVIFSATVSAPSGISSCHLYVDLEDVGEMALAGSTASRGYTFSAGGSRIAFVYCQDHNGNRGAGPNTAIWVEGPTVNSPPLSSPSENPAPPLPPPSTTSTAILPGSLVKLPCLATAAPEDPCRAVYYYAKDGKRHAFPNSKVYFTWYTDFASVVEVSAKTLSGFPLGKNVTYRPGVKMVKFTTTPKVYAVAQKGLLRWVTTQGLATLLYGTDWSTKIDDISDVFYTNYTFGTDINGAGEYNPADETSRTPTIDDNF